MMRERNRIAGAMEDIRALERTSDDAVELWDMAESEGDTTMFAEVEASLRKVAQLVDEINRKWPFARDTQLKLP